VNIIDLWQTTAPFVFEAYGHSMAALGVALVLALVAGVPAGLLAGVRPHSRLGTAIRLFSILGTITPSFLLALFILIFFVLYVLPLTGIRFVLIAPQTMEFDPRRMLPITLTLAARPLAYFVSITAAATSKVIASAYINTARAKGLSGNQVLFRHIWPNVLPDILTAIPATLLFSLSSLPVVEFFFNWPGLGLRLLFGFGMINLPRSDISGTALVSFLLLSIGVTYILVRFLTEFAQYRLYAFLRQPGEP